MGLFFTFDGNFQGQKPRGRGRHRDLWFGLMSVFLHPRLPLLHLPLNQAEPKLHGCQGLQVAAALNLKLIHETVILFYQNDQTEEHYF